jgi:tRNA modification GTPase
LTLQTYRHPEHRQPLDQGLTAWFPAPYSFTGEDCAELQIHGGAAVIEAVLQACLLCPDLRLAEPGEFTRRAVANGRLDLVQAEALADLIDSETEAQRVQAQTLLQGALGKRVRSWRERLIRACAYLEAGIDFADEGDVDSSVEQYARPLIREVQAEVGAVLEQSKRSIRIRNGFIVALAGPPNAGKSTLINAIAQREISIVSPFRGTTRDAVEARCSIGGCLVTFVDLAGLRETKDPIEKLGIEKARDRMREADLVIWLTPCDEPEAPPPEFDCIIIQSKIDLASSETSGLAISARTGANLGKLLDVVSHHLQTKADSSDSLVSRERHRTLLSDIDLSLKRSLGTMDHAELAAEGIRVALGLLSRITDPIANDDILDHLFKSFCIGK